MNPIAFTTLPPDLQKKIEKFGTLTSILMMIVILMIFVNLYKLILDVRKTKLEIAEMTK